MRMRPLMLAAAGVLSAGLASGMATATASAAAAPAQAAARTVARAATPAAFTASAAGYGPDMLFAEINARATLNAEYTGCTNVVLVSSRPLSNGWFVTVAGTCTGTA